MLGLFGNALRLPTHPAEGRVILGIHQEVAEGLKRFRWRAAGHPGDLANPRGVTPFKVVTAHDLFHVRDAAKRRIERAVRAGPPSGDFPFVAPTLDTQRRFSNDLVVDEVLEAVRIHVVRQGFGVGHDKVSTKASMRDSA